MLKQGDDLVAALDAVRAEEDRLGAEPIHIVRVFFAVFGIFIGLPKRQIPTTPIPNFVRGRESTWLTFVLENPPP